MATTRRQFSAQFKREAVQRIRCPGTSIAQVAKDLQLGVGTLRRWVKQFESGHWEPAPGKELNSAQTQELERLRRELRRVVGWSMSPTMTAQLVIDALMMAIWRRKPSAGLILHSNRGSQYASDIHRQLIKDYGMIQSMSRRANCWDNAPIEHFFKTLKVERTHRLRYDTRAIAKLDIVDWIEGFYRRRMHSSIGYQTPAAVESRQGQYDIVSKEGKVVRFGAQP